MEKPNRKGLSGKLKQNVQNVSQEPDGATTSPYFSPRKTRNQIKIEYEKSEPKSETATASTSSTDPNIPIKVEPIKKPKSKRSTSEPPKPDTKDSKNSKWEPENWKEIIDNLKIMRKSVQAPVDTMGCDKCSDETADKKTQRFHKLVALMLSSQTKDQVTYDAMTRLKSRQLIPKNLVEWQSNDLEDLLVPVSFYKNKAKYLQKTARILIDEYDSDIPSTVEDLMKLPGVGPKMAHICMSTAWNVISGIGVDVHVHRISNRLKWVKKPTKQPENTRLELEDWLPSEYWSEVNALLVGFGQTICTPINPKCEICLNNQICPSAFIAKQSIKAKKE